MTRANKIQGPGKAAGKASWAHGLARLAPRAFGWLPFAWCLLQAGCASERHAGVANDPLLGGSPVPQTNGPAAPASRSAAAPAGSRAEVPALPGLNSTASTAALASGTIPRLPGAQDLRLESPQGLPSGWQREGAGQGALVAQQGALLRPPEPVGGPGPVPPAGAGSSPVTPVSARRADSLDQALDELRSRGVSWQTLEGPLDRGEWKFRCSVPNPNKPSVSRTYEATASASVDAVRAVLDQINRDQR
jgi:hypothetical protein